MCGIAGYSLSARSSVDRTLAAQALLAGIAERGADAAGYAYRVTGDSRVHVHKRRTGASGILEELSLPETTVQALLHVRDYTKGHPTIADNNHPVRHGKVVGIHNGIIRNDDELFARHEIERESPAMTVDSEIIFALAELSRGRTAQAFDELYGSMATAWLDEERPELFVARGVGRPVWLGHGRDEIFFASTRHTLELVERFTGVGLCKNEVGTGSLLAVKEGRVVMHDRFHPDHSFEETPLPSVRAPHEGAWCVERLAALHAAA